MKCIKEASGDICTPRLVITKEGPFAVATVMPSPRRSVGNHIMAASSDGVKVAGIMRWREMGRVLLGDASE